MSLCSDAEIDIPDKVYHDEETNKNCNKSIKVKFSKFFHRTMVYRSKEKMSKNARIKVDLTKKRFTLQLNAKMNMCRIRVWLSFVT